MPCWQGELGKFLCLLDFLWDWKILTSSSMPLWSFITNIGLSLLHRHCHAFSKVSDGGDWTMMDSAFLAALVLVDCIGHDDTHYVQSPPTAISYEQYKLPSYPAITNLTNSFRSRFNACHICTSINTVCYISCRRKTTNQSLSSSLDIIQLNDMIFVLSAKCLLKFLVSDNFPGDSAEAERGAWCLNCDENFSTLVEIK